MFAITDRLLLRPAWAEDAAAVLAAIGEEAVIRNLALAPWPYGIEHAAAWIGAARPVNRPTFLIFERAAAAPVLVGAAGIHDTADGATELGYWIARAHWGRGFATEAGNAVVGIARDTLRVERLIAGHFLDNPASGRVLRKLGFRPTGLVGMRRSAGRGGEAPCAQFVLELNRADAEPEPAAPACLAA